MGWLDWIGLDWLQVAYKVLESEVVLAMDAECDQIGELAVDVALQSSVVQHLGVAGL